MNIFVLYADPVRCAKAHCDKHVVKMILETAQLLSTTHHILDNGKVPEGIYKSTHRMHPCAVWARQSAGNYTWLHELGMSLCAEYTHRYLKTHKTQEVLHILRKLPRSIARTRQTPWAQCMPDQYRAPRNAIQAYRAYYMGEKARMLKYTNRPHPSWLTIGE